MECKDKGPCRDYFRRGSAACANCALRDRVNGACEEGEDGVVDADGRGDGDCVTDEFGNEGAKLYDVGIVFERSQVAEKVYRVAADSEEEAKERAENEAGYESYGDLDWDDQGNGTTDYVETVDEVDD